MFGSGHPNTETIKSLYSQLRCQTRQYKNTFSIFKFLYFFIFVFFNILVFVFFDFCIFSSSYSNRAAMRSNLNDQDSVPELTKTQRRADNAKI